MIYLDGDHTVYGSGPGNRPSGQTFEENHREIALWAYRMGEHPRSTDAGQRLFWSFLSRYDGVGQAETLTARRQVAALRS